MSDGNVEKLMEYISAKDDEQVKRQLKLVLKEKARKRFEDATES